MPIYEYKCEKGHTFEVMQSFSDEPLRTCQTCGAPVRKVLHPVAVHFKGSGFHNTDYGTRRRAREAKEGGEGSAASGEGAKPDTAAKADSAKASSSEGKAAAA
jgi:putative FmdB family regulatory protein